MSYKCENCGAVKEDGSEYYRVRIVNEKGITRYVPTCSEDCANQLMETYTNLHLQRASDVKQQIPQKMLWGEK